MDLDAVNNIRLSYIISPVLSVGLLWTCGFVDE